MISSTSDCYYIKIILTSSIIYLSQNDPAENGVLVFNFDL